MVYFAENNSFGDNQESFAFRPFSEMGNEVAYGMNSYKMMAIVAVLAFLASVGAIFWMKPERVMEKDESGKDVVSKKKAVLWSLLGAAIGAGLWLGVHRLYLGNSEVSEASAPLLE